MAKKSPMRSCNLPGLANVDHVDPIGTCLPEIGFHVHLEIFRAQVALGGEEHLNVLRGGIEHRRNLIGRHICNFGPSRRPGETKGVCRARC